MSAIPFSYIARNLWARKLTTVLTAAGMALVVYVFATVLMLARGTEGNAGGNRKARTTHRDTPRLADEVQSGVDRPRRRSSRRIRRIAMGEDGRKPHVEGAGGPHQPAQAHERQSVECRHPRRDPEGLTLRRRCASRGPDVRPGTSEIIAGRAISEGFRGAAIGETLRFAQRDWTVVGVFDAGRTGFNSEIWGDAEQLLQAFRRVGFSALIFRIGDAASLDAVKRRLESDPRLQLEAKPEQQFYADQSEALATFISYLGTTISVIFSIGAIIGAMITMYASVASRTAEIGTLRALGFSRLSIMAAFLVESLLLGLVGGAAGLFVASFMQMVPISTTNFQTFSEIAFTFTLTPSIIVASLGFALFMGFIGGFLPAARAARLSIVDALRAA
jgi:hypothetical protein